MRIKRYNQIFESSDVNKSIDLYNSEYRNAFVFFDYMMSVKYNYSFEKYVDYNGDLDSQLKGTFNDPKPIKEGVISARFLFSIFDNWYNIEDVNEDCIEEYKRDKTTIDKLSIYVQDLIDTYLKIDYNDLLELVRDFEDVGVTCYYSFNMGSAVPTIEFDIESVDNKGKVPLDDIRSAINVFKTSKFSKCFLIKMENDTMRFEWYPNS